MRQKFAERHATCGLRSVGHPHRKGGIDILTCVTRWNSFANTRFVALLLLASRETVWRMHHVEIVLLMINHG